jgi:hypothetical protein
MSMAVPAVVTAATVAAATHAMSITNTGVIDMRVRCKFQLQEITEFAGYSQGMKKYVFRPQYDDTIPEDRRFQKYSPSGEFWILVDNPAVHEEYKNGHYYYFDSIEVPETVKETPHE